MGFLLVIFGDCCVIACWQLRRFVFRFQKLLTSSGFMLFGCLFM
jgi:hypothetical protein